MLQVGAITNEISTHSHRVATSIVLNKENFGKLETRERFEGHSNGNYKKNP